MELELSINGVIESLDIAPGESLLTLLRREGYHEIKNGCGTGDCGACTVLIDGVARPSCMLLAAQAGGCTLATVDGLAPARQLHPLQQAFIEAGAIQCGFCTPGMLLSAFSFLQQNPDPTENEVRDALSGNLCHCTGYEKPVQAVLRAAAVMRGDAKPSQEYISGEGKTDKQPAVRAGRGATLQMPIVSALSPALNGRGHVVGRPLPVIDAVKLVRGEAAFADDVTLRGMLYGRVLSSPHAHAVIRDIDVAQARALPGVHAVLTYKDVARSAYASGELSGNSEGPRDQYILDYRVRYIGDRVAVVAAETPEIAEQALRLIQVDYNVQPAILDPRKALDAEAAVLHPEGESRGIYDAKRNVAARLHREIGDLDVGFAAAELVVENEYVVPLQQPQVRQSVVTYFDEDDSLVVRTGTQIPDYIRRTLSALLSLPARRIRVIRTESEGEASQELLQEDLCALLTVLTKRPVTMSGAHGEELLRVSQQSVLRVKTGVKRDGTLVANQMILLTSTGAHATHPLITRRSASFGALALYPCQNMRFAAEVLYTTLPPMRAAQEYSDQQEFFALECQMDEVARQLGMDALELRRKNLLATEGVEQGATEQNAGLASCLRIVEEKLRWREMRGRVSNERVRRGVGVALSLHGDTSGESGKGSSGAILKLNADGSFDVFASAVDALSRTLAAQVAAEVLGVTMDDILLHTSDTSQLPSTFGSGASSYSSVIQKAAEQVRRQVLSVAGRMLGVLPETLSIDAGVISAPKGQSVTVAQVAEHTLYVENRQIMTTASVRGQREPLSYAARGVEVEVDTETGELRVLRVISAVDAGRVLNPLLLEGQVQGDSVLELSSALSEELFSDAQGAPPHFDDYRVLNSSDAPPLQTYLVENDSAQVASGATYGAATSGIAPALANAVADALSTRIRYLPLTPERVLRAIYAQNAKK